MFGFGRKAKIRKAVQRALGRDDFAAIEALEPALRGAAYGSLALAYYQDERLGAARGALKRALALAPDDVDLLELAATVAAEEGRDDDAIAARRRIVEVRPREPEAAAALGRLLLDAERVDEALALLAPRRGQDPATDLRLAEALFVDGDAPAALALLDGVCAHYDGQLKELSAADFHALRSRAEEASNLRADVYASMHGAEAAIELSLRDGKLDARAGVNYRLLGARLAVKSPRVADVLHLEDPDATERRGRAAGETAAGLSLIGIAQLRRGAAAAARKTFDRACELDGTFFPAFLGLGAAIDHERFDLHRRALRFPAPPPSRDLARILPDLPALTDAERRVVWAAAEPLAAMFPLVAAGGVQVHILPLDVRATDVELFRALAGVREDGDQRSYDAITGVATHGGAVAKIEELLDVADGWTFAHELAHIAFFHMPEATAAPIVRLYEAALDVGYAHTEYALSNLDEFFACSYVDWLHVRHDLPGAPERDDAGLRDALTRYFEQLAASARPPR